MSQYVDLDQETAKELENIINAHVRSGQPFAEKSSLVPQSMFKTSSAEMSPAPEVKPTHRLG